jgi:formylglycine-generating enzyme required for sulfatase activity
MKTVVQALLVVTLGVMSFLGQERGLVVRNDQDSTIKIEQVISEHRLLISSLFSNDRTASAKSKVGEIVAKPTPTPAEKTPSPRKSTLSAKSSQGAMPQNAPLPLHRFGFVTVTLDSSGMLKSRDAKNAYAYTEGVGGGVTLEMVAIPPGEFMMGSSDADVQRAYQEAKRYDDKAEPSAFMREKPQHRVRIANWYFMGKFEVTQAQWRAVMGNNPSYFKDCDNCPVEQVSWNDALEFCRKLSARTGHEYRLPSEAEWEYGARAGTTTPFAFGDSVTPEIVNYNNGSATNGLFRGKTVPVGSLGVANGFGLYDMHGNVWEWCRDWYQDSYAAIAGDAPSDGGAWLRSGAEKYRVLRGGSWLSTAAVSRSAIRYGYTPVVSNYDLGFRVVSVARTQ